MDIRPPRTGVLSQSHRMTMDWPRQGYGCINELVSPSDPSIVQQLSDAAVAAANEAPQGKCLAAGQQAFTDPAKASSMANEFVPCASGQHARLICDVGGLPVFCPGAGIPGTQQVANSRYTASMVFWTTRRVDTARGAISIATRIASHTRGALLPHRGQLMHGNVDRA